MDPRSETYNGDVGDGGTSRKSNSTTVDNCRDVLFDLNNATFLPEGVSIEDLESKLTWEKLTFKTVDEVYIFYESYARMKGFSMRKDYAKRAKINGVPTTEVYYIRILCNKEGLRSKLVDTGNKEDRSHYRREERTNCGARLVVHYSPERLVYSIKSWIVEHNHDLVPRELTYMLRGSRRINPIQQQIVGMYNNAGIKNRSSFEVMALAAGGFEKVGFLPIDLKNHLGKQRQRTMKRGEATALNEFFRYEAFKNPSFFYGIEVDNEEQIANIFWADMRMRLDYKLFGDAIAFDTTYRTNKEYRPLALFVGFNNHRKICVFGAALLFDETSESFEWLFRTFLNCMDKKTPQTIFTDQDAAIAKALAIEMPGTYHALCTWHILENAKKRLSHQYTDEVSTAFKNMIYNADDEDDFDIIWNKMHQECFPDGGHDWLSYIYRYRTQWSSAWVRQHFTAGMVTTQLVESCNSNVRGYLQADYNLVEFFTHFNNMINNLRHAERMADFDAKVKLPRNKHRTSTLVTSGEVYTQRMFDKFQHEYEESLRYLIDQAPSDPLFPGSDKYRVSKLKDKSTDIDFRLVVVQKTTVEISCTCHLYETLGILCRHILRVMSALSSFSNHAQFRVIPERYIMKRWTINAKEDLQITSTEPQVGDNYYVNYQYLTNQMNHLAALVSMDSGSVRIVDQSIRSLISEYKRNPFGGTQVDHTHQQAGVQTSGMELGKSIKKRVNPNTSRKRLRSACEVGRQKAHAKHKKKNRDEYRKATDGNVGVNVEIDLNKSIDSGMDGFISS